MIFCVPIRTEMSLNSYKETGYMYLLTLSMAVSGLSLSLCLSSRIFVKILFQELAEFMGIPKLNERLRDPYVTMATK